MKTATVISHARLLGRIASRASFASMVPDALPQSPAQVGDLPEFAFIRIGAWAQARNLEDAFGAWIKQGGHQ